MVSALAVSFPVCLLFWSSLVHGAAVSGGPSFMMISGISASEEMCLTAADGRNHGADLRWLCQATASMTGSVDVDGADVVLEPCAAAIAAGDGRELWQLI
jgi:hypothetical protein